jgi:methanogenic corrinoid protein MtbC1
MSNARAVASAAASIPEGGGAAMLGREPRVQPPVLDTYSDLPLYNTKAVVHQTGVPAPTLRAWERRYGILTPRRSGNDYRLYSERDIILVSWLRERVESGMTISQAIALLRSLEPVRRRPRRARVASNGHAGELVIAPAVEAGPSRLSPAELGGALLAQLVALDEAAASRIMAQALAVYSVEDVCLNLYTPVLHEIGRLWEEGEASVAVEHFASMVIRGQLMSLFRSAAGAEQGPQGPLTLVGCAPDELHEIGALMLALMLRRLGVPVAYLGQSVEPEGLAATVEAVRPACVMLSASLPRHAQGLNDVAGRLARGGRGAPTFCFGGRAFTCDAALAGDIAGEYLEGDARTAAVRLKKRLVG